jgi:nucleoid-associated protein YgaU
MDRPVKTEGRRFLLAKVLESSKGCQSQGPGAVLLALRSFDSSTENVQKPVRQLNKEAQTMRRQTLSRPFMRLSWLCMIVLIPLSLLSTPASAITESDKGTILKLPDDAFLVPEPFLYEVKGNDNLHWLAAKFYGDARQWVRLYEANQEKVRNPSILRIGQQLLIPSNR